MSKVGQRLDPEEMMACIEEIAAFAESEEFQALLREMRDLPHSERGRFVKEVVINENELEKRGIQVPEDMVVQRSYFGDERPTLFCVTKYLSNGESKVTVTYDDAGSFAN